MNRTKSLLSAAAALVIVGGVTASVALQQAGESAAPAWTCAEWSTVAQRWNDRTAHKRFFALLPAGVTIPEAYDGRLLGTCAGTACTVSYEGCDATATWDHAESPAVNGVRVIKVRGPAYIGGGLRKWVKDTSGAKWLGGLSTAMGKCIKAANESDCAAMLGAAHPCWLLGYEGEEGAQTPRLCNAGRLYAIGEGGAQACTIDAGSRGWPCDTYGGSPEAEADEELTDDELDATTE